MPRLAAVVFDMDGVLVDTESVWDAARRGIAERAGRPWPADATTAMMGMSSPEWSAYLHETVGVPDSPEAINRAVVDELGRELRERLPLIDGAGDVVAAVGARWPLAIASSANREVIDLVLELSGLGPHFAATVSSEEVAHGKPAPDVYLEAATRLGVDPRRCAAVEDSSNGLRSAAAAGMAVIAFPNRAHPPDADALAAAQATVERLGDLPATLSDMAR